MGKWIKFFLVAIEKQAIVNLEKAEQIRSLYEHLKSEFTELLTSKWSIQTLDFLFTNPIFRNNKFTNSLGIPHASAALISRKLVEAGYIKEKQAGSGRRATLYSFEPLLKLVRV